MICDCLRCGHQWIARKIVRPVRCPKCVRANWWREARPKPIKAPKLGMGRPRKYMFNVLNVGMFMTFPWDEITNVLSFKQCLENYSRRTQRKFTTENVGIGLKISRIM